MKGNIQLCKADICVKAEGDYAKIILVFTAIAFLIAGAMALKKLI
jgi:hypothetical protein